MKILDVPQSGKRGQAVAFQSRYGLCLRQWIVPRNVRTPARQFMRQAFGHHSQIYSHKLTQEQLDRWNLAAGQVMSDPRLGRFGPLTGQQLYTSINSVRSRVNLPESLEVPARPTFGASPVGSLAISNSGEGVRLLLRVSAELTEDVMVFGQAPCNSGRRKRRNVAYLGLLPPPINGWSDITSLYLARYGEPRPGTKVFIVTCQQKDGWKAFDQDTSDLVPDRPKASQTIATPAVRQFPNMHKGVPRDAEGISRLSASQGREVPEPEMPPADAGGARLEGNALPDREGGARV